MCVYSIWYGIDQTQFVCSLPGRKLTDAEILKCSDMLQAQMPFRMNKRPRGFSKIVRCTYIWTGGCLLNCAQNLMEMFCAQNIIQFSHIRVLRINRCGYCTLDIGDDFLNDDDNMYSNIFYAVVYSYTFTKHYYKIRYFL